MQIKILQPLFQRLPVRIVLVLLPLLLAPFIYTYDPWPPISSLGGYLHFWPMVIEGLPTHSPFYTWLAGIGLTVCIFCWWRWPCVRTALLLPLYILTIPFLAQAVFLAQWRFGP